MQMSAYNAEGLSVPDYQDKRLGKMHSVKEFVVELRVQHVLLADESSGVVISYILQHLWIEAGPTFPVV